MELKPLEQTKIVTFCGSTRFKEEYLYWQKAFTMEGWVVISVGVFGHADDVPLTEEQKTMLDRLHLNKIMLAELVFIIDKDGYTGESTKREIAYAELIGKTIKYLSKTLDKCVSEVYTEEQRKEDYKKRREDLIRFTEKPFQENYGE
jgi:hypothetical protein